jgi:plastocyanin
LEINIYVGSTSEGNVVEKRQQHSLTDIIDGYLGGRISRRDALQLVGALGIAGFAGSTLAARSAVAQDAGTPAPAATPVLGPQADGSNVWKVQVGGMDMENAIDLQAFFPGEITINAGDSVFWAFAPMGVPMFHTVTFTSGGELPGIFAPDIVDGTPVASPEGPPRLMVNPAVAFPDGRTEYDGTGVANSGLDILRTPDQPPYTLKFTTPGTYDYVCLAHAFVMKGKVTVQEAGAELPTDVAGYETMAQEQIAALIAEGTTALTDAQAATPMTEDGAAWDVSAGVGGESQARVMQFVPREVTIKVGDKVRWMDRTIGEPHTVTFLGGEEQPEDTIVEPQPAGAPKLIQNFQTFLPSGEADFDGNGYRNSGFLGLPPEVGSMFGLLGDSYELTFTAAGEYPYYCIPHSGGPDDEHGMAGKVIVEE